MKLLKRILALATLGILFAMFGCATVQKGGELSVQEMKALIVEDLKRTHEAALKAYESRDLDGYLASFHDDITIFYTGTPPLYGKDSVRRSTESTWEMSEKSEINWYNITYRVIGDTGIVLCNLTAVFRLKDGQELRYNDRTSLTYVRQDGKWFVVLIHSSPLQQ